MRRILGTSIVRAAAFAVVAAGISAYAASMTPAGAQDAPSKAATASALAATLSHTGRVRVIVQLQGDFQPEHLLAGPEGIEASVAVALQRARIRQGQDRVLADLAGTSVGPAKRFQFVPFMGLSVDAPGLDALVRSPNVAGIQEDRFVPPTLFQSVPLIGGDVSTGFPFGASNFSGAGQMVAVLDTGVYSAHPFLSGKVLNEACYSTNDLALSISSFCPGGVTESIASGSGGPCLLSIPGCDHGTHVAGIVAGWTTNIGGLLYSGVAKDASLLAIQVFSRFDDPAACGGVALTPCIGAFFTDVVKGLERVYALRGTFSIASANLSLGGGLSTTYCDAGFPSVKAIIDLLRDAGIATVIASGNDGFADAVAAPACVSSAVTVGSSTKTDAVSWFSNNSFMVDLLAPGSSIGSSVPLVSYEVWDGTSMAAPHVAGAFAVLKSSTPAATVNELEQALKATGTTISETRLGVLFAKPRINVDQALAFVPPDSAVGDFNADATSDILWRHNTSGDNIVWTINGFTKSAADLTDTVSNPWYIAELADFNGDGMTDILWRNPTSNDVSIWMMNGSVRESSARIDSVGGGWVVKGVADFDGDGMTDILWRNQTNGTALIWRMNGFTKLGSQSIGPVPTVWQIDGVADFNGDGRADILWRNSSTGSTLVWQINFVSGAFVTEAAVNIGRPPSVWRIEDVGDFNGDGQPDLLWRNTGTFAVVIWQMNGYTKDVAGGLGTVSTDWQVARLGDYDGDGLSDILWRNPGTGANVIWEMNGPTKVAPHPLDRVLGWSVQ